MKKTAKQLKDPQSFISGLKVLIVGTLIPLMNKFPSFETLMKDREGNAEDFDFYMLVAIIGYYLYNTDNEKETDSMLVELQKLGDNYLLAIKNLQSYVNPSIKEVDLKLLLGMWVLHNLKGDFPTQKESQVASAIGAVIEVHSSLDLTS